MIAFLDETVLLLQPLRRRTWAPCGHTPIQKVSERRNRLSVIGVITVSPRQRLLEFFFQVLRENISLLPVVWFLTQMHRHFRRHIVLIWDSVPVHVAVEKWFAEHHPTWFRFERLPKYAPELNPTEECWDHTKYMDMGNFVPSDADQLETAATQSFKGQGKNQKLLRSYFAYAGLRL